MSYVRQIHKEAMAKVKLAIAALVNNDLLGNSRMLEEAYLLEKEAAQLLADEYETEPTRSVLFRSAASLAIQVGAYSDAMDLIKTGLNGNTHHEIKEELFGLLKTIDEKVLHEFPVIRQEAERLDAPIDLGEGVVLVTHNSPVIIVNKAYQVSQVREPAPLTILQVQLLNLLRLQEYFKKSFKGYQADVLMSEAQVQASIEQYIQSKHTLISAAIGKADTLSVWYAANYFMELYAAVNRLEADGVRVHFCAYEEDHLEHSLRTCLAIVPTKKTADGGHSNILSERQPGFVQGYSTNRLPAIYVPSQLLHQRVQNYLAHQYPILSKAIGKADTRCVWYSKDFLENVLSGMAYFNANGVRLCLGSTDSPHDFGRTTLITVLTHEHHDNTVNLVYNEYAKMANGPNHEAVKGQIMAYWGPILEYAMSNNDI